MEELALREAGLKQHLDRRQALAAERCHLLDLPPAKALDRILEAPQPAALVHSFAAQDLYLLIHDIGPDDALPLLALAAERQIEHLLDRELWYRDRLCYHSISLWLHRLYLADPKRTVPWLLYRQPALLEAWLFQHLRLHVREHDQDPSEMPPAALTFDDVFYVELLDPPLPVGLETMPQDQREHFVSCLLADLAAEDHLAYQQMLFNAMHVLPAEAEEEAYQQRCARMEEMGFLPYQIALEIYQPLRPAAVKIRRPAFRSATEGTTDSISLPRPPLYPLLMMPSDHLLGRALAGIDNPDTRRQIHLAFVSLANQVIMADQQMIHSREQLRRVVAKACGYLNIGLESLARKNRRPDLNTAVACIQAQSLTGLFRVGYGKALALKHKARSWLKTSWFRRQKLGLAFWGEDGLGRLGGLLLPQPVFFDDYQHGSRFREFTCLKDVALTNRALQRLINLDQVLDRLNPQLPRSRPEQAVTYKNTLLTLWAYHYLKVSQGSECPLKPLRLSQLREFLRSVFQRPEKSAAATISSVHKRDCLEWLAEATNLPAETLSDLLAPVLEDLFNELETELGQVTPADLDPRYVHLFLVDSD